jgi:hypothetical protein
VYVRTTAGDATTLPTSLFLDGLRSGFRNVPGDVLGIPAHAEDEA